MRRNKHYLYVPADSQRKINSALKLKLGAVILDLEDGVAPSQKQTALENIISNADMFTATELWVRLNQVPQAESEFASLSGISNIGGFWIPKAEPTNELIALVKKISESGKQVGVLMETAKGYVKRQQLLSIMGITHLQLGEYDLAGELGIDLESEVVTRAMASVRLETVIAAKANSIRDVVGAVSANYKNLDQFNQSCKDLAALGFDSRACIHPDQLAIADTAFTPTPDQIAWAEEVFARFEENDARGAGAYVEKDGSMADAATVRAARSILEKAKS